MRGLAESIKQYKGESATMDPFRNNFIKAQEEVRTNPNDFQAAFDLAGMYLQMAQTDSAVKVLNGVCDNPKADVPALRSLLTAYSSFGHTAGLEKTVGKLEAAVRADPANTQKKLDLAEGYRFLHKNTEAAQVLDQAINSPGANPNTILAVAQGYAALRDASRLEGALEKLTKAMPTSPEAWYDLAVVRAGIGKASESLAALRQCLSLNAQRLQQDSRASNLLSRAREEPSFASLRQLPEFQKLVSR